MRKILMHLSPDNMVFGGGDDVVVMAPQNQLAVVGTDLHIETGIGVRSADIRLCGAFVAVEGVGVVLRNATRLVAGIYWVEEAQLRELHFKTDGSLEKAAQALSGYVHIMPALWDTAHSRLHLPEVTVNVMVVRPGFFSRIDLTDDINHDSDGDGDRRGPDPDAGVGALIWSREARKVVPGGRCELEVPFS